MKLFKTLLALVALMGSANMISAQSFTVALKNGEKYTYNNADVDSIYFHETPEQPIDPDPVVADPRIGDFYYSDGTWSTDLDGSKSVIGIVFRVGIASDSRDNTAYYKVKDGSAPLEQFHGYVVSLRDATRLEGYDDLQWWSPFDEALMGGGSNDETDFLGYTNTLSIRSAAGDNLAKNFPATYYATDLYEKSCPAPESSSGWFFPSAGMLKYIYDRVYFDEDNSGRSCVLNSLKKLDENDVDLLYRNDSEYWSSTEKLDAYGKSTWAYYVNFDERSFKPGFVADYRKNTGFAVRSVLAF